MPHLDRYSCFCRLISVTDRLTDHATWSLTIGLIDRLVLQCGLKIYAELSCWQKKTVQRIRRPQSLVIALCYVEKLETRSKPAKWRYSSHSLWCCLDRRFLQRSQLPTAVTCHWNQAWSSQDLSRALEMQYLKSCFGTCSSLGLGRCSLSLGLETFKCQSWSWVSLDLMSLTCFGADDNYIKANCRQGCPSLMITAYCSARLLGELGVSDN